QESENRIVGFGGCNNFFGTYNLTQPDKISFSPIGATKMACLTTTFNENDFFNVFEKVNNYKIRDQILTLFQDNQAVATLKADKTIAE
ncbi:MAG TPA: META domain-containing protein, partial [Flavobacteriaceae bacterium]|nr:META domain-containing protein [Flavobacteriaceae bacterium]